MKYANEIFFFVSALILWGLLFGSITILRLAKNRQPERFWLIALSCNAAAFTLFAVASTISITLITPANTLFVASFVYLGLFCHSLSRPVKKYFHILVPLGLLVFAACFEFLRQKGSFVDRVTFVSLSAASCLIWELIELKRLKHIKSTQLRFLFYTIAAELALTACRLTALYFEGSSTAINLYQEGVISASIRWAWLGIAILSYIAVLGYWMEKLSAENIQVSRENQKITELLKEKERLIYGLMKANKTAATGALSASIAHELNQPLGASNLNIQFLKMKLEKGVLNPELGKEILDSLEEDNKRAATIVNSLRSIFTDSKLNSAGVRLGDLISKVLDVVKPELKSKNIQIQLKVDEALAVRVNSGEIEQVILNLVNNAIHALANSGALARRISIEVVRSGDMAQLSVTDNGGGVPAEFRSQLFELLSTTKQTGMGLGLWLCKHIVGRYGGTIQYEEPANGGAQFLIKLPVLI
jgi:signal transduction histidine kinase